MKKSRIASPFPTQNRPCVICRSSMVADPAYSREPHPPLRDQLAAVLTYSAGSGVWISGVLSR